jgi:hypothetical protein
MQSQLDNEDRFLHAIEERTRKRGQQLSLECGVLNHKDQHIFVHGLVYLKLDV